MFNRLAAVIAIMGYLISSPHPLLGQEPQLSIRVLTSFDYPGLGNSTTVEGINDSGDVVGSFQDGAGTIRGFIRFADGTFSAPIIEPHDTGNVTVATDINNLGGSAATITAQTFTIPIVASFCPAQLSPSTDPAGPITT